MSTDLLSCLQAQTWRTLRGLARANAWPFDSNLTAAQAARHLHALLSEERFFRTRWSALSTEARAALVALLEAGGRLPREEFLHRFGPVRPHRPWRADAPPPPWKAPGSPAEAVVYQGLAFFVNLGTTERPAWTAILPDEFHPTLSTLAAAAPRPAPLEPEVQAPEGPGPGALPAVSSPSLLSDLFALLSFLNRQEVHPIWNRWLPPTVLRELNEHLNQRADLQDARSERRDAPYVAFLHYLAERAGLVTLSGQHLKPTLAAHEWLSAPGRARLERLWAVWNDESAENLALWQTYHLPGWQMEDALDRFRRLLTHLARRAPGQAQPTEDFLDHLINIDPPLFRAKAYAHWAGLSDETRSEFQARVQSVLVRLLDGPLTWFGLLAGDPPALTPLGAALLGRDDGRWPQDPPPARLFASPQLIETPNGEAAIHLSASPGLPPPFQLWLETLIPPDPQAPGIYRLTRSGLLQALQGGAILEGIVNRLEGATGGPLPPAIVGTIYRWAEAHEQLSIRRVVLLEAQDPDLLQELARPRRIRETLAETLSARAVRVHADRLPALLRRLAARGYHPRLDLPASPSPVERERGPGGEGVIALALRIYAELAEALNLPGPAPHALARRWTERLSLSQRDAVERATSEALERLRRAAPPERDYRLPSAAGPLLRELNAAIDAGRSVEIRYYTAGRDHETSRRVDPLRLEWRGEVAYLIAHCHLRGEQRVFRVDRIAELERV